MIKVKFSPVPRWRVTETLIHQKGAYREILVALQPEGVRLRLKGLRQSVVLPWGVAYDRAHIIEANARRTAKRAAKVKRH